MTRVLVTGGAGFIGSHLVDALLAEGSAVRVLDNFDSLAHPEGPAASHLSSEAELITGSVSDPDAVATALEGVSIVYHLGGVVGNGESMVNVRRATEANSLGTATLLEAVLARREKIRRLVVASSMVVYGEGAYRCPEHDEIAPGPRPTAQLERRDWEPRCPHCDRTLEPTPIPESWPLAPLSVYGITKRDQEELCLVLGRAYGLETVALRYLNVYGPRQALGNPYTGVAAIFASRLLAGRRPLIFEDGGQLRDFVHVDDIVAATRAAGTAPDAPGRAFNVSTGRRVSIRQIAELLAAAMGSELEPEVTGEFRHGDIRHCLADATAARERLGFVAEHRLEDRIDELVAWVEQQTVSERGDEALAQLRGRGLVG
ncbi:MAG: NAD-dependent epimerase/dehydratase family protein [Solirubrobacterales bacterium]